mmetsp:Transcript_7942/g.19859  ORF Transcript_7942/g.19859 Transcript_7942/m.19859 type:complete len:377 (-) Transcript_7942:1920-3050(-)|eukprot:CAMPEP_0113445190 /NCGR_PEP_ID=MMETSP0014_2-20120614/3059_1 /TAXON_ID=2857 /ORGANISM="Nitzschia sp." /LENGTH=376 /DNA_ID=CAMNT_0000336235 /DNA_START=632 /DNA_END=1762 /DNA_ORIENTATION=+ /assembly_acc=CAM_ASM_000159
MGFVSQIMTLPFVLLWYTVWFVASIFRPLTLATFICMLANPKAAQAKIMLIITTFQFLLLSKDKKWKKSPDDPASFFEGKSDDEIEKKTVIFLRHGESTWNDTFNKGDRKPLDFILNFIPNLVKSFGTEWYFLVTGQSDESWFFDSPLSLKGISQAEAVAKYLKDTDPKFSTPKEATLLKMMTGDSDEPCQLVSSNLRRAISTCSIALKDRLDKNPKDTIVILEELQEASINPDALSIHPPYSPLVTAFTDSDRVKEIYATQCDTTLNKGNKPLNGNGLTRLEGFCKLMFPSKKSDDSKDAPKGITANNIMATGHSYYFRAFFQTYLPKNLDHVSKKKKLVNGGVVGFTLMHTTTKSGEDKYMIDPNSLVTLYGGF